MYGKIFCSIYDGTLYGNWEAIATFQQLIVLANADGVVDMTPQAIAARTSFPLDMLLRGIKFLESPDPYSRTPGEDGKRIVLLDQENRPWGWQIVNHGKYTRLRNMEQKREADRERLSEKRKKINDVAIVSQMSPSVANVAHTDTDTDTDTKIEGIQRSRGSRLSPEWFPSEALTAWATKERQDLDLPAVVEKFKDYWRALPGSKGVKLDWDATFRNFLRNERAGTKASPDYSAVIAGLKD